MGSETLYDWDSRKTNHASKTIVKSVKYTLVWGGAFDDIEEKVKVQTVTKAPFLVSGKEEWPFCVQMEITMADWLDVKNGPLRVTHYMSLGGGGQHLEIEMREPIPQNKTKVKPTVNPRVAAAEEESKAREALVEQREKIL